MSGIVGPAKSLAIPLIFSSYWRTPVPAREAQDAKLDPGFRRDDASLRSAPLLLRGVVGT